MNDQSPANRKQTKKAINCGDTKFWQLLREGEFPNAFKVGREIRVPWQDIEDYKSRHRINAGEAA